MTKKIFAMFLAVLMVVSMLPTSVFAANECPGKNNPKHSTSNCDYTVVKVTDPTCGTDGHTSYKCNKCGYTFAEKTADATGEHSFVAGEGKAPTCVNPGYEAGLECEVCGLVKPGKEIPKLDKDATSCEWEIVSGYDCDNEKGKIVEQCAFCGDIYETTREEYEEMLKELDPDFVPMEEHVINWSKYVPVTDTQVAFLCYGAEITGCSHYVVADIKNAHDCADYTYRIGQVDPTCTTDGMKAHDQCRICNTKYGYVKSLKKYTYLTAKNIEEEYVIKAAHSFVDKNGNDYEPTCADTLLFCKVCEKYVNPGVEHDIDWELTILDKNTGRTEATGDHGFVLEPAKCNQPGFIYDICGNCGVRHLQILEATGHNEITVTMPSTCGTYAYTFTYCTNENCDAPVLEVENAVINYEGGLAVSALDENGMPYSLLVAKAAVTTTQSKLAKGFMLGMVQENLGKTLYFNGEMDGKFFATTTDIAEAVTLKLEQLANFRDRYFVYFTNEAGEKVYINVSEYKDGSYYKAKVSLTTETPDAYFTWDATRGIFVAHGENEIFFLGTYNSYNTISASSSYYMDQDGQFKAQPYTMSAKTGVQLTGFELNVKGGYNAEKHVYDVELGSVVLPTCTKAGSYNEVCGFCFDTVTVEIPAGCLNNLLYAMEFGMNTTCAPATAADLVAAGIKNTAPAANATCTEGAYQYFICTECESVFKLTLTAPLGHHMSVWHDDTAALNHTKLTGYIGYDCAYCNYAIKLETISWKNANKLYDTLADAKKDHEHKHTACDLSCDKVVSKLEYVQLSKNGSCTVTGIELYTCTGCGKNVRVRQWQDVVVGKDDEGNKIYESFPTGEHAGERLNHQDPTCTSTGFHTTYQCARCDAIIGNKELGVTETLKKLPHSYVEVNMLPEATIAAINAIFEELGLDKELKEYEAAPCDKPNYDNIKYICVECLTTKGDGTENHVHDNLSDCKDTTIEVYTCHCGEVHIRSMGSYDHKWFVVEQTKENKGSIWAPATCYQFGWYTVKCEYCGKTDTKVSATVEHENAAGEKFTDSCLDEVTDRHCVVCCEFFKHDAKGNKHDCTKTDKDEDGNTYFICETVYHECSYHHDVCDETCEEECKLICADDCKKHCDGCLLFIEDGCQVSSFCHYKLAANRPSTCVQDAHTLYICRDCGDEIMKPATVNKDIESAGTVISEDYIYFYGHKPMAGEAIFANYTYLNVKYQEVIINDDGEFELVWERISNAQFVEYKAPTFNADGYAKFYCAECKAVVEQVLPKLSGMGFELDIKNANGQDGFTYGSLIEVTVSINGNDVDVNNFTFDAFSGFEFVGFETLNNELFHLTVTDPASDNEIVIEPTDILDDVLAFDKVTVTGVAANTAAGKMQNVNINEKTELVKLFFRIDDEFFAMFGMEDVEFMYFVDGEVNKWISGKTTETIYEGFIGQDGVIDVECLADFDGNGYATVNDLSLALTLLTGEHPTGATYDVTVDMNKDGVITLEDLSIAHNWFVDNLTLEEVFYMGMSEAEIELFEGQKDHFCVNCGYEGVTEDMKYCPECGRNPHAK